MTQKLIALIIVLYFLAKVYWQKKQNKISAGEFFFWLVFWVATIAAIVSLQWIDRLVADLGFSGSGIEILLYLGVAVLFYFIFRLRLRLAKIEKDITKIVRGIAIDRIEKR